MIRESGLLHANTCKVYMYDDVKKHDKDILVGGLQDLVISFEFDNYYYDYVGGRELRIGKPSVKGTFRQGILDFSLLGNMFFQTALKKASYTDIDLKDYLYFHQDKVKLELIGIEEFSKTNTTVNINKIILREVSFNSLNFEIRAGMFVLSSGSFMAQAMRFGHEEKKVLNNNIESNATNNIIDLFTA